MKNILITGGAGFIGYHLATSYVNEKDVFVYIIDDFSRGKDDVYFKRLISKSNFHALNIDLSNIDEMDSLKETDFDIVYHFAATNGTNNFYLSPDKVLKNNILSTINLLDCVNAKQFVFASTCETYHGTINMFGDKYLPTKEDVPLIIPDIEDRRASYGISKIACESYIINKFRNKATESNYKIIRYHNVYGERMGKDGHVIPDLINRIKKLESGDTLQMYGANQTRAFIYIKDAIRDTRRLTMKESMFKLDNIFNIGVQEETNIGDLAYKLIKFSGKKLMLEDLCYPKNSVNRRLPDMKKFEERYGKYDHTTLDDGLRNTYNWYMQNN